jgi:8-oxo-dGTP pyrophosphatase MutT (NUDIX family)
MRDGKPSANHTAIRSILAYAEAVRRCAVEPLVVVIDSRRRLITCALALLRRLAQALAMDYPADCFLRHIRACNNAVLPGRRSRLRIGAAEVGWVLPEHAPLLVLADRAAFDVYVTRQRRAGAFRTRSEAFDVRDEDTGAVVATVDRGAIPVLGIRAEGVHMNGLVQRPDGLYLWVGRRAPDKRLDPDKLDHLTAGGIPAGHDALSTLVKEADEEASLPAALVRTATPVGVIGYAMERAEGLRRDRLYCFDLMLDEAVVPRPNDDEVVAFSLWPIAEVARRVAETDDFKFNVNLVLIDLLLRTGTIDRDGPIDHAMAAVRQQTADTR